MLKRLNHAKKDEALNKSMLTSSIEAREISIVANAIKAEGTKALNVSKTDVQRNSKSCLPSIANEKGSDLGNSN